MPEESIPEQETELITDRSKERAEEDEKFVPVIIRRSDERVVRHPTTPWNKRSKKDWNKFSGEAFPFRFQLWPAE